MRERRVLSVGILGTCLCCDKEESGNSIAKDIDAFAATNSGRDRYVE